MLVPSVGLTWCLANKVVAKSPIFFQSAGLNGYKRYQLVKLRTYKLGIDVELIEYSIPHWMEVACFLFGWQVNGVTTSVSNWEIIVYSTDAVEWLMDVSSIVDQKSESIWLSLILSLYLLHDILVSKMVFVISGALNEINEPWNSVGNVLCLELEVRVVWDVLSIINVREINEVPFALPLAMLGFDVVSKSGTLNEWVVSLLEC